MHTNAYIYICVVPQTEGYSTAAPVGSSSKPALEELRGKALPPLAKQDTQSTALQRRGLCPWKDEDGRNCKGTAIMCEALQ